MAAARQEATPLLAEIITPTLCKTSSESLVERKLTKKYLAGEATSSPKKHLVGGATSLLHKDQLGEATCTILIHKVKRTSTLCNKTAENNICEQTTLQEEARCYGDQKRPSEKHAKILVTSARELTMSNKSLDEGDTIPSYTYYGDETSTVFISTTSEFPNENPSIEERTAPPQQTDDELASTANLSDYDDPATSSTLISDDDISSTPDMIQEYFQATQDLSQSFHLNSDYLPYLAESQNQGPLLLDIAGSSETFHSRELLSHTARLGEHYCSKKCMPGSGIWRNELTKKLVVALGLMAIAQAILSVGMINSGFLGVHLASRNISGTVYGLVGSGNKF